MKRTYGLAEASGIAESLEIDFAKSGYDLEQFRAGLDVEAEHGAVDPATNVTNDDPLATGKITLAHLKEIPDYYTRLNEMETGAEATKTPGLTSMETEGSRKRWLGKGPLVGLALLLFGICSVLVIREVRAKK
jgi:Protein of unknown function (DUF5661)